MMRWRKRISPYQTLSSAINVLCTTTSYEQLESKLPNSKASSMTPKRRFVPSTAMSPP
jgi:hypothetical protein